MPAQDNSRSAVKRNGAPNRNDKDPFWSVPASELLQRLETTAQGLTGAEAEARLSRYGANSLKPKRELSWPGLLLGQFKSPLVLILVAAAILSFFLHDRTNAGIILGIVVVSAVLGFWQEYSAAGAVAKLLAVVQVKVQALRLCRATCWRSAPGMWCRATAWCLSPKTCLPTRRR
jgi:magnesium-transporting ATPase (P-type)